jgi:hypothetical protein
MLALPPTPDIHGGGILTNRDHFENGKLCTQGGKTLRKTHDAGWWSQPAVMTRTNALFTGFRPVDPP